MNERMILLIRHSEAKKNIADQHGGEGTSLTNRGLKQSESIAQYILSEHQPLLRTILVGHKITHVKETTEFLSQELSIKPIWEERIRGLDLGVIAGLSREDAAKQWPEAAERLEKWRKSQLRIDHLDIPYAEPLRDFENRIKNTLYDWIDMNEAKLIIAICTRSTLIMLVNLIELYTSFSYKHYKPYVFEAGSITQVDITSAPPQIVSLNYLGHLKNENH